jgi:hypothetical protein
MLALFALLFVMLGFLGFLVIWDSISNLFRSRMITGGILGFLLAKYLEKKDRNRGL